MVKLWKIIPYYQIMSRFLPEQPGKMGKLLPKIGKTLHIYGKIFPLLR